MTIDAATLAAILVMALAAALCRFLGYGFMRFIPVTPRLEAGLRAIPLAIMIGIIVPPVLRGGVPELAGLAATVLVVHLKLNDLVAILVGMGVVAALRAAL
jgi:uncharacterized membrane protein